MNPNRQPASSIVQIDNDLVKVTEWRFAPDAETGWHRHEYDYLIVPVTSGTLKLMGPDGAHTAFLTAGQSYFRNAGVEHNVINGSGGDFSFVEVELKPRPAL
jgi:beta-alanine degradation protein BauB